MTDRLFRLCIGLCILAVLYFDLRILMVGLIAVLLFEAVTNWRIPVVISRLRYGSAPPSCADRTLGPIHAVFKIGLDAERVWRAMVAGLLILTYLMYYDQAWFVPWFMGFAITGAGLSGICPMVISLKLIGFR